MHKVHHHWQQPYTDSKHGAILYVWDRLQGTLKRLAPADTRFGLDQYYLNEKDADFTQLIKSPFTKQDIDK